MEGRFPIFISSRNRVAPRHWGSLFIAFYDSQGYGHWLGSYLNDHLISVSVSWELFVDGSYPWTRLLIPQQ
jgi:hypothetical protein